MCMVSGVMGGVYYILFTMVSRQDHGFGSDWLQKALASIYV